MGKLWDGIEVRWAARGGGVGADHDALLGVGGGLAPRGHEDRVALPVPHHLVHLHPRPPITSTWGQGLAAHARVLAAKFRVLRTQ
jgi:hypothetical protein